MKVAVLGDLQDNKCKRSNDLRGTSTPFCKQGPGVSFRGVANTPRCGELSNSLRMFSSEGVQDSKPYAVCSPGDAGLFPLDGIGEPVQ